MIEQEISNIVITAHMFNPSIFSQIWLVNQGIVEPSEFGNESVVSPALTQHKLKDMQLVVIPARLQVSFSLKKRETAEKAKIRTAKIIELLQHTPFEAVGLNFEHTISIGDSDAYENICKRLFLASESPLASFFDSGRPRFGAYYSRDFETTRLKLDIKPITLGELPGVDDRLKCIYNFHLDVRELSPEQRYETMSSAVEMWDRCRDKANELTHAIIKRAQELGGENAS